MAGLQIVPAGARSIAPGVFQLSKPRRSGGGAKHHKKGHKKGGKHGLFARQWVWFALALVLGEVLGDTLLVGLPGWISAPALLLFAYGTQKKKPGAINAAYAIQSARMASYFGATGALTSIAKTTMSGGGLFNFKRTDFTPQVGSGGGTAAPSSDVANAVALIGALNNSNGVNV